MEGDIVERLRRESNGVTVNLTPGPRCAKPQTPSLSAAHE
jgi:hypothetical protein